ncbi:MAG: nuclear transport factor 2 family protein [Reichenbachiella sp.]|uniref:nuclear transport factor 2 family protein n=1 Tax=Reichenbachiella sp. TaxID=2184521 RepID=UPI003262DFF9
MKTLPLILILAMSACEKPKNSYDKEKIAIQVADRFESFVMSMNELSGEELSTFYSDDPRFYWVEDGRIQYANKEALMVALTGLVQSLKSTNLEILKSEVEVLDEGSVMLFAEYEQVAEMKSGFSFNINGAMTVLLQKEQGVWKFLVGHSSSKKQRGG